MGVIGETRASSTLFMDLGSFFELAREERAELFLFVFCALFGFLVGTFLFAFFNSDTIDFYSRSIDITWITRRNGHQHIQSLHDLTKDRVFVIQMWCGGMSNKKLRAVRVGARVRHGKNTLLIMFQARIKLISKLITRS